MPVSPRITVCLLKCLPPHHPHHACPKLTAFDLRSAATYDRQQGGEVGCAGRATCRTRTRMHPPLLLLSRGGGSECLPGHRLVLTWKTPGPACPAPLKPAPRLVAFGPTSPIATNTHRPHTYPLRRGWVSRTSSSRNLGHPQDFARVSSADLILRGTRSTWECVPGYGSPRPAPLRSRCGACRVSSARAVDQVVEDTRLVLGLALAALLLVIAAHGLIVGTASLARRARPRRAPARASAGRAATRSASGGRQ